LEVEQVQLVDLKHETALLLLLLLLLWLLLQ
jgi:hypothetical protein